MNLRGYDPSGAPLSPAEAIRGFLDALGAAAPHVPAGPQAQAGLYRSLLAGQRMLILLDNARDAAQVRPLLPGSAGCLVLVTSRSQLTGLAAADGARLLTVDVLTGAESRTLLTRRLGAGRVAAEPAAAAELTALCARLPLALNIAAARAGARPDRPLAAVTAALRDERGRLDAFDTGEPASSARTVFFWSYRHLSEPAARMFRLLGLHPGPDITVAAAASLAGVPAGQASRCLGEHEEALACYQRALALHREIDNRDGECFTWDCLGNTYYRLRRHDQAVTCFRQSARLFRELGNQPELAAALTHLGDSLHAAGHPGDARAAWQEAHLILDGLHDPSASQILARLSRLRAA